MKGLQLLCVLRTQIIAIKKPHQLVASCTVARWLKETLRLAGIDVFIFSGHSVRGASTSAAAGSGVTMTDIMQAADWSSESVFRRFYYRPSYNTTYGRAVLSSSSSETKTFPVWCMSGHIYDLCGSTSRSVVELRITPLICENEPSEM